MDGLPEMQLPETTHAFPPPQLSEPTVSVVIHEEPKKRRTGLFVAVGAVAVAAIVAAGFLLLNKNTAEATYSLKEANAAAAEMKAVAFTMTMSVMGQDVTADAETDATGGLSHIVMDLGVVDSSIELIADINAKVIYIKSSFLKDSGLPVDTEWVKMDEKFLQEQAGTDESLFDSANLGNPLDAGAVFDNAKSVTEIGFDEVDGVKVKHFVVVVDTLEAMKVSPQLQQQMDQLDAEIPDELTYDVYVDEQNQIRRTTIEMSLAGQKVSVDIVIKPQAEPIVIEIPKPADVTDFADLI
jgi:hypothetical protein